MSAAEFGRKLNVSTNRVTTIRPCDCVYDLSGAGGEIPF